MKIDWKALGLATAIAVVILLTTQVHCQELPNAPSHSRPVVLQKKFWVPHSIMYASVIFDYESTHQGIANHKCTETNPVFNPKPSRWQLYRVGLAETGGLTLIDYALAKAKVPWFVYDGPALGEIGLHLRGGLTWYGRCGD